MRDSARSALRTSPIAPLSVPKGHRTVRKTKRHSHEQGAWREERKAERPILEARVGGEAPEKVIILRPSKGIVFGCRSWRGCETGERGEGCCCSKIQEDPVGC